jgi:hypothetical protein
MPSAFTDTIEEHPLKVIVGVIVATVVATFAVVTYFHDQHVRHLEAEQRQKVGRIEDEISQLTLDLASIPGDIPFTPGIPIEALSSVVEPDTVLTDPGRYELLRELRPLAFFAVIDHSIWTLRKIFEAEHIAEFAGIEPSHILSQGALDNIKKSTASEMGSRCQVSNRCQVQRSAGDYLRSPTFHHRAVYRRQRQHALCAIVECLSHAAHRSRFRPGSRIDRTARQGPEEGSGLLGQPERERQIAIYRSTDIMGHILFFILNEAHQPLFFGNQSEIVASNIFNTRELFYVKLDIREEAVLFEDGSEGDLLVTRKVLILKHDQGYAVISVYLPTPESGRDAALLRQMDDWIKRFRVSRY